jgi:hypothetical protein
VTVPLSRGSPFRVGGRAGATPVGDWLAAVDVTLTDLVTGETLASQSLPAALGETLEAVYALADVPGLSHQPQQFTRTGNQEFQLELRWRAKQEGDVDRIADARRFLSSLCYPRAGANSVVTGAPSRVLFVWPNVLALTCTLHDLDFNYSRFSADGHILEMTAKLTLMEIRDVRLLAETVRAVGALRGEIESPDYSATMDFPIDGEEIPPTGGDEEQT